MNITGIKWFACALAAGAALFAARSRADEAPPMVRFAAPVRIKVGDAFVGAGRLYPSPVLFDMNGDGKLDIVVGDLIGKVTVAHRTDAGFAAETAVQDRDGKPLKFHNW